MAVYPNKGALFNVSVRRSDKSPDMSGNIKLDREYLKSLKPDSDGLIEVKLSAWNRTSASGNEFLSLSVDTYVKPEEKKEENPW